MKFNKLRALLLRRYHLPKERAVRKAIRSFSIAEKAVFYFFVFFFVLSGVILLWRVNDAFMVKIPTRGGTLTEGVIGNPRFINPVLAFSEADRSITSLVYSGLEKVDEHGDIVNDLADSIKVSPDNLNYIVHIRPDAFFQDGTPVTADDVVFTINKIQDPNIKSPLYGDWSGVGISAQDDHTVIFALKKPYAPFLDNLTLGILPKHIWNNVSNDEFAFSQYNTLAIGSGPYKINTVQRNSGGIPDYYDLMPFNKVIGQEPYIENLVFKFYPSEDTLVNAYRNGDIDSLSGISADNAKSLKKAGANIISSPLPRIFGVFFNQSQNKVLLDPNVREALDLAAPKQEIVKDVLGGYATPIDSPIPPDSFSWQDNSDVSGDDMKDAAALLAKSGWVKNSQTGILEKKSKKDTIILSFSISTGDTPELKAVANKLAAAWQELGAQVRVLVFDTGDLNQNIIRPRRYDALLFGEVIDRNTDLYPFWHSSQRLDPGINIALYANSKVDKLLEDARKTQDSNQRSKDYKSVDAEIKNDVPAVFLYSPNFIYALPQSVQAVSLTKLATPDDRFDSIRNWYIETDNVWKIFVEKNKNESN